MRFEWDGRKAAANARKHGVTFEEATEVFYDPNIVVAADDLHSHGEPRLTAIGYSVRRMLFVVYVERDVDVLRLISARTPTPAEKRIYEGR